MYWQQNLNNMQRDHEQNNYPKAVAYSTATVVLFLVISYLITFGTALPDSDIGTGGVVVNYGTVDVGMGEDFMSIDEPSVAPNPTNSTDPEIQDNQPTEPVEATESSDKAIVTQDAEDAPSIAASKNTSNSTPSPTVTEKKPVKPAINENALYKGKKNNGVGAGDGTGDSPGNQGDPDGDPMASNYGEGGSGFGDAQLDLKNRRFLSRPTVQDNGQSSGRVAVEILVDKNGEVVRARAGVKGTTLSDRSLWEKCERAVLGARLNQLESAPDVQIGTVIFNFKVK